MGGTTAPHGRLSGAAMPDEDQFHRIAAIGWAGAGPDPRSGPLTEVAAVLLAGEEEAARFSARAAPAAAAHGADGPESARKAGGGGRPALEVLQELSAFVPPDAVCVVHNADAFTEAARKAASGRPPPRLLDTLRLSGVCFPSLPGHGLGFLRQTLCLPEPRGEGAQGAAEVTARLWLRLRAEVLALPQPIRQGIARLLRALRREPLREFFQWAAAQGPPDRRPLCDLLADIPPPRRRQLPEDKAPDPLDPDAVTALLDPEGPLALELRHYEYRDEQVRMARAVVEAFNAGRHLVVEAGTGVGKSLAYLLPAMLWAVINDAPVIVSTNTRNLQAQLVEKDLPLLCRTLRGEFRFAMIKGRRNYLCLKKLLYLLAYAETELEPTDRLPLASILVWLTRTTAGDIGESMVGERPHLRDLASRLTFTGEECRGQDCEQRRHCFLQRARRLAMAADVVVANHAVVFSEMAAPLLSPVLPPYRQIIFDEAHNLEDAVTSALSREVSLRRAQAILNRLVRPGSRRRARGLVPTLQRSVGRSRGAGGSRSGILTQADAAQAAVRAAQDAAGPFFAALSGVVRSHGEEGVYRLRKDQERPPGWDAVEAARKRFLTCAVTAIHETTALADALAGLEGGIRERLADFDRELRAAALWLEEFCGDVEAVLDAAEPAWVCWAETAPPAMGSAQAWGAPIEVGPLLHRHLYSSRSTVVFTSATMTVNGATDFFERRLGIGLIERDRLAVLRLGTVFDYARQSLILVPSFLPEPDDPRRDYAAELCGFLAGLFRRTGGRALALFTSHDMLQRCAGPLRRALAGDGIRVFAQGLSGSRESLLQRLTSDPRTVLLGAHSFWEGVDVVGANLSCVVLARLPFAVHTDPVVAARREAIAREGGNPFLEYSLPAAVVRFRQGFGRLIRHRRDRGVVVVADRRIVTRQYGEWFRASVAAPVRVYAEPEALLSAVDGFLARE